MTVPTYRASPGPADAAIDDLFRAHAVGLVRFALMLVGDQSTAEDVVQEAFLGLYRAWDRIHDGARGPSYLYTLTLAANGTAPRLSPLGVPRMTGDLVTVAASSDGKTVGYALDTCGNPDIPAEVGVITGHGTRQWTTSFENWPSAVTLSADGSTLGFITSSIIGDRLDAAWVLPTSAPPGSITTAGRKLYSQHARVYCHPRSGLGRIRGHIGVGPVH